MSAEHTACEDLKAFERRLTEVITCIQPSALRWRTVLTVVSVCTAVGAWCWLSDPVTQHVTLLTSLYNHIFFTLSSLVLVCLFASGIHRRVVAPAIICARSRTVLADFNMWCDDSGKLILKRRPSVT